MSKVRASVAGVMAVAGARYGRLTIVRVDGKTVDCRCECGQSVRAGRKNVLNGNTKSCGCLRRDRTIERSTKHGGARRGELRSPEYLVWQGMLERCSYPKHASFRNYGGRGIRVLYSSFAEFLADVGPRPHSMMTIERKDNGGHYGPGNCRWATRVEQANNSRKNHLLTFRGETKPVGLWARQFSLNATTLIGRIRGGWPVEEALTSPLKLRTDRRRRSTGAGA